MSELVVAFIVAITASALGWGVYMWLNRRKNTRQATRMSRALTTSQAVFTALEHIPDGLINRDLRIGLVLLLNNHLAALAEINPKHPILRGLQDQVLALNRMPSGFQRIRIRDKQKRKYATLALEEIAKIIHDAVLRKDLAQKPGDLARAAATFIAQQVAIENARQAAKDAENVRAYQKALNFAYQAQSLCKTLPPLMAKHLTEAVGQDIERLESSHRAPV